MSQDWDRWHPKYESAQVCTLEGCERPRRAREWCHPCYMRLRRKGQVPGLVSVVRLCTVMEDGEPCPRPVHARGMCGTHHSRWRLHGDPLGGYEPPICSVVEGGKHCSNLASARGFCDKHYRRWQVHGDPLTTLRTVNRNAPETCTKSGCSKPHYGKGRCKGHYNQDIANPKRRARKLLATVVDFTPEQIEQRMSMFGFQCWMCGGAFEAVDHVKPLSRGGPHMLANLRPACHSCNSKKGAKWPLALLTAA